MTLMARVIQDGDRWPDAADGPPRCPDCDEPFKRGASMPWVAPCLCEFCHL